jgi:phosphatidylglycerol lysyltransferase
MARSAPSPERPREFARELVREHGFNATSFQTVGEGFSYFFQGEAYVAYADTGAAWVAAGAPVCRADALRGTVQAFTQAAGSAGRRCCFFGVEPRLLTAAEGLLDRVQIGEQPVWNPADWEASLRAHRGLREQLRRARAKGVTVRDASDAEQRSLAEPLHRLSQRWLATRAMPPMGFLVAVSSALDATDGKRFVAWWGGRIVGVAHVLPVPGRNGWFLEHLLRDPEAPNGSVELLVDAVMRWAASMGCSWLTLGLSPLSGSVPPPLRFARKRLRFLYDFEGLRRFKQKLRPCDAIPIYLAFPPSQSAVRSMLDALTAFSAGGMLHFGFRFVLRGHPAVLGALAALLVPWTVLLAFASPDVWFAGHASVKWAWVSFDVVVCAGLVTLLRRPSWWLAALLATMVSADALLTALEAALWNLPRLSTWLEGVLIALACTAPAFASLTLWGAALRLKRMS